MSDLDDRMIATLKLVEARGRDLPSHVYMSIDAFKNTLMAEGLSEAEADEYIASLELEQGLV